MLVSDICADGSNGNEQTTLLVTPLHAHKRAGGLSNRAFVSHGIIFLTHNVKRKPLDKGGSAELTCHASLPLEDHRFESVRVISVWLLH